MQFLQDGFDFALLIDGEIKLLGQHLQLISDVWQADALGGAFAGPPVCAVCCVSMVAQLTTYRRLQVNEFDSWSLSFFACARKSCRTMCTVAMQRSRVDSGE